MLTIQELLAMGFTATQINDMVQNRIVCAKIESQDAKCHPSYGDGRSSYKSQNFKVVQDADGQWWAFIDRKDSTGAFKESISTERLEEIMEDFGKGHVKRWDEITWSKEVEV